MTGSPTEITTALVRPTPAAAGPRARGMAVLKALFLVLMGRNGDRGLPGGKPGWGPVGRAALERILAERACEVGQVGLEPTT